MKTLEKIVIVSFLFCLVVTSTAFGQNDLVNGNDKEKPQLKTLKDYNNYVASIDVATLNKKDKIWLTEQYNNIIEKMDQTYHKVENVKLQAAKKQDVEPAANNQTAE